MDETGKKCSFIDHREYDVTTYCVECKIYLCNKCNNFHSKLFLNHHQYTLEKGISEIFIGLCKEPNHNYELDYYCKEHNQLCCIACIAKIKTEKIGQHKDCSICLIKDIKEEKKNKLKENIISLENLSKNLEESIKELKILFEKINENKDIIKQEVQNIFTKIRNQLNEREDKLLLDIDEEFNNIYFNEEIIKQGELLPKKIKNSLEKGQLIDKEWDNNNKLNYIINECLIIENNINKINIINDKIIKCKSNKNKKIKFYYDKEIYNKYLDNFKKYGQIYHNQFRFKKCPNNVSDNRKYKLTGDNDNVITKTGSKGWMGTICDEELDKSKEHKWKIKILNTKTHQIMLGVAPIDFDINSSHFNNCGWYYDIRNALYSGPPHNFSGGSANLNTATIGSEIIVVMNMNKKTLKFIINNEDKGDSYTNIPTDKPLAPAVLLKQNNDSVEISEY